MLQKALLFLLTTLLTACGTTTPMVFGGARTTREYSGDRLVKVTTERTPSVFGIIFGETTPTPGEEAIREGVAHRLHGRATVDESRAGLNDAVGAKLAVVESPDHIRALAELRSANTPDEGSVSAYSGGRGSYGRSRARAEPPPP